MKKRKPKIIKDKKKRGEWAESVFMARAGEHGLPVSTPWGEMCSYDFIVGRTGRFCSVQVKSTICQLKTGYDCTVRGGHKAYPAGSFDFLAAFVVPEDAWYIIPAKLIRGKTSITLTPESKTNAYEQYREAWHLLREAAELGADRGADGDEVKAGSAEEPAAATGAGSFPTTALGRMEAVANFVRRQMQGRNVDPRKRSDDIDI